jgi:hypothetical protein
MKSRCILISVVLVGLALLQGCTPGYNSVLFATRSNLGFDAETTPPNLEIAFSRCEAVLEPTFEGGKTMPVLANFSSASGGLMNIFSGVNSTFATGKAADIMSYLYLDDMPPRVVGTRYVYPYEPVTLTTMPTPKRVPFGMKVNYIKPGDVKPVVFGTDTTLGMRLKWSGMTAQYPSSFNIGFKRKEATFAPIAIWDYDPANPQKRYAADVTSLLATIDTNAAATGMNASLRHVQYFATGCAADYLALRKEVRDALRFRVLPSQTTTPSSPTAPATPTPPASGTAPSGTTTPASGTPTASGTTP